MFLCFNLQNEPLMTRLPKVRKLFKFPRLFGCHNSHCILTGLEAQQTSKEKQRCQDLGWKVQPGHNLLFCAHTLCLDNVTNTFLSVSSSVRSK